MSDNNGRILIWYKEGEKGKEMTVAVYAPTSGTYKQGAKIFWTQKATEWEKYKTQLEKEREKNQQAENRKDQKTNVWETITNTARELFGETTGSKQTWGDGDREWWTKRATQIQRLIKEIHKREGRIKIWTGDILTFVEEQKTYAGEWKMEDVEKELRKEATELMRVQTEKGELLKGEEAKEEVEKFYIELGKKRTGPTVSHGPTQTEREAVLTKEITIEELRAITAKRNKAPGPNGRSRR